VRALVGASVLLLALDGGGYSLASRHTVAVLVWWAVLVGFAVGAWPREAVRASGVLGIGFLGAFALWTGVSIAWAPSAERAFLEFDRAALMVGVFLLVTLAVRRDEVAACCDGLAIGLASVGTLALGSRLLPQLFPDPEVERFLPEARGRLTFPVEYWNGLGVLLALAVPLLLRSGIGSRTTAARSISVASVPVLAAAISLTSSRGAALATIVGGTTFVLLTARRWSAVAAVSAAGAGSVAAIAVFVANPDLANAVGDAPREQGPIAALLIALVCLGTAVVYGTGIRLAGTRRPPAALGRALAAALLLGVLALAAAADPVDRLEAFKRPPGETSGQREAFVSEHLLSGGGSGRWQFWSAAVQEFRANPLSGGGAGSFESWWAQHGTLAAFIRDAHSLYLETLAELGPLGLALLLAAFLSALAGGLRRLDAADHETRATVAALAGCFLGFALAAGIDWHWELTVVPLVGVTALALLAGPAAVPRLVPADSRRRPRGLAAAALAAAWLIICLEALPLLTQLQLRSSQAAVRWADLPAAIDAADAAARLQPWAASPRVQQALVYEQAGALEPARRAIEEARARDSSDWRIWLIAARLETKAGDVATARRSLARAVELNPRSPLLAGLEP